MHIGLRRTQPDVHRAHIGLHRTPIGLRSTPIGLRRMHIGPRWTHIGLRSMHTSVIRTRPSACPATGNVRAAATIFPDDGDVAAGRLVDRVGRARRR